MDAWMNDVPTAVRSAQRRRRADVPELSRRFAQLTEALNDEVSAIRAEHADGGAVPEVRHADVAAGMVSKAQIARIKRS